MIADSAAKRAARPVRRTFSRTRARAKVEVMLGRFLMACFLPVGLLTSNVCGRILWNSQSYSPARTSLVGTANAKP